MCNKCDKLQNKIMRYRDLSRQGLDSLTVERIDALILDLQKRKEAILH
jgi:hypothetical protein